MFITLARKVILRLYKVETKKIQISFNFFRFCEKGGVVYTGWGKKVLFNQCRTSFFR